MQAPMWGGKTKGWQEEEAAERDGQGDAERRQAQGEAPGNAGCEGGGQARRRGGDQDEHRAGLRHREIPVETTENRRRTRSTTMLEM